MHKKKLPLKKEIVLKKGIVQKEVKPAVVQEVKKEESLKEKIQDEKKLPTTAKEVDILIPQRSVLLEDVSVAEPNEPRKEVASLENIVSTAPAPKTNEDEKLNYGPGGKGKFYESGSYKTARYEDAAKYEPPRDDEPTAGGGPPREYHGVHASDKVFERFVETKKKEEEFSKYKKKEH